jgi:hypothetical protein
MSEQPAQIECDPAAYGLPDFRPPRYAFHQIDKDGKRSLVTARYEPVLIAVTEQQKVGWERAKIVRTDMPQGAEAAQHA